MLIWLDSRRPRSSRMEPLKSSHMHLPLPSPKVRTASANTTLSSRRVLRTEARIHCQTILTIRLSSSNKSKQIRSVRKISYKRRSRGVSYRAVWSHHLHQRRSTSRYNSRGLPKAQPSQAFSRIRRKIRATLHYSSCSQWGVMRPYPC